MTTAFAPLTTAPPTDPAARFATLVQQGIDAWRDAGRLLITEANRDPAFEGRLLREHPQITRQVLDTFRRIGAGLVLPELVLEESRPGIKALLALPIEQQRELSTAALDLALPDGSTAHLTARELTADQARQVFGGDGPRGLDQQRAWLAAREGQRREVRLWTVQGDRVLVHGRCLLTPADVRRLVADLADVGGKAARAVDWAKVDWSKSTSEIVTQVGREPAVVSYYRRKFAPQTLRPPRPEVNWDEADWSKTNTEIANQTGASYPAVAQRRLRNQRLNRAESARKAAEGHARHQEP